MNNGGSHFLFATFNLGVAENVGIRLVHPDNFPQLIWLVVEPTHLRNITQIRSSPQVRFKIRYKCLKPLPPSHFVIWEDFVLQENVDLVQGLPGVLPRSRDVILSCPNPLSKKCRIPCHGVNFNLTGFPWFSMMAGLGV